YLTVMNENYAHPALPPASAPGILKGGYSLRKGAEGKVRARLLGSGTILREVLAAAEMLEHEHDVAADVYSITSFSELRRDALEVERWNLLHPEAAPRVPYVSELLAEGSGPVVAATDYMRAVPDQVRQWVPGRYATLGTDGFGRSDCRAQLRAHFEVDRRYVVVAALKALCDQGQVDAGTVAKAIATYGIDPEKPSPVLS
ncbi:MAG: transketolase-like TK C-terminal-containing protein, partial [Gammaproteobacteria bacterium]